MLKGGLLPFPRTGCVLYAKAILSYDAGIRQVPPGTTLSSVMMTPRTAGALDAASER